MKVEEIMQYLPHRYPMLLVDRILEVDPGKSCVGLKNVTINEQFFCGHYPDKPVMPGVLIVEAMAQAGAIIILSDPQNKGLIPLIGQIGELKLKRSVVPGDQLITRADLLWYKSLIGKMRATSTVDGEHVATVEMAFKLVPREA